MVFWLLFFWSVIVIHNIIWWINLALMLNVILRYICALSYFHMRANITATVTKSIHSNLFNARMFCWLFHFYVRINWFSQPPPTTAPVRIVCWIDWSQSTHKHHKASISSTSYSFIQIDWTLLCTVYIWMPAIFLFIPNVFFHSMSIFLSLSLPLGLLAKPCTSHRNLQMH